MTNEKIKIGFICLGCDKNRVDLEDVISALPKDNFETVGDEKQAEIILINTCAFLKTARDEAKSIINEMSELKKTAKLKKLVVMGCLPQLEKEKVLEEFKQVDAILVPEEYSNARKIICDLMGINENTRTEENEGRRLTTPMHYAYLKIADGCNNRCAFCKIPFIKGQYKSRKIDDLVNEAKLLCEKGVKEIILVAQDVTNFGFDTGENLVDLLEKLSKIKKLVWIRLLYCYPDLVDDRLIEEIKNNPKIVHYIDMPLQHASDNVLLNMCRKSRKKDIEELILKLRREIPDIKIRSTFMVGFPEETDKDFKELCSFLKKYKLDNVGFFKYSREEDTKAYDMEQVSEKVKDKRLEEIQKLQEKIAISNNKKLKGKTFKVVVDKVYKDGIYEARPYFSAPDVDFLVYFTSYRKLNLGAFVDVTFEDFKDGIFIAQNEKNSTY